MRFDFLDRRSAERFAELLDETTGGPRHHSRGPADEQLAELVAIGNSLSGARPGARVDPEFRTGLRAMLVATAERDGIGRTATAVDEPATAIQPGTARSGRLRAGLLGHGGRIRARGAIVIGVAAGALAVSGISAASENASPGDALYGVKRSTERAQLAMAGSDVTRGQLSLDFARNRLAEAVAMRGDDAGFAGVLDDMDADTRKGVKLLTTSAVARKDIKPLATIDTFAEQQRRTLSPALGRFSPGNQERALKSITLLDSVSDRAESLRTGLACGTVTAAGSDALGPKLKGCAPGADTDDQTSSRPSGHAGKPATRPGSKTDPTTDPQRADPAVTPSASSGAAVTGQRTRTSSPALPPGGTPVQSTSPPDLGETVPKLGDEQEDPLGGLLGGLLGNR
ncbi:DUF5667 domain-containing protein [Paractinoplanes brasiliensis]|uniref:DUF5667 domain-containing protein n=1 Tax=Paractinoplanes brasiliensis TaxID=52695 RepID=A0A4R6JZ25_9ACTN|nr:DUF5667 domain-containing protein [Actinoplanes brasiliensis]TDO40065.1 hypothetical protein C8E87_3772 [Actinoplanes brasiliensis]GID25130.1 hypothetical protein Abr02nite_01130 [Actinoplanes brasiliensis]